MKIDWSHIASGESKKYKCGYCGESVASEKNYVSIFSVNNRGVVFGKIYICHHCHKPTFFDSENIQTPGAVFGESVKDISDDGVSALYEESRKCYSSGSFTSAVLACRKLLMHIAVSKGAKAGLKFIQYVEFLSDNNFIPPGSKEWVDHIREKGNEANHEIVIMKKEEAEDLISFIHMLLKIIYEFPANMSRKTKN